MTSETPVVLVAADDPDRAGLYAEWLDAGCDVRVVHDGPEALDALDRRVDVVVLAASLRDATDDDLLHALREEGVGVRVVAITDGEKADAPHAAAPDEVLADPVSPEALRRTVSTLAARRAYERGLRDLFSLAAERAAIEADEPDAGTDDLDARIDALRGRLDETLDTLTDEEDLAAVYRAIDRDLDRDERP